MEFVTAGPYRINTREIAYVDFSGRVALVMLRNETPLQVFHEDDITSLKEQMNLLNVRDGFQITSDIQPTRKDPNEQVRLAEEIGQELTEYIVSYVKSDIDFPALFFLIVDALDDIHVIATGQYELLDGEEDEPTSTDLADERGQKGGSSSHEPF